jgi:hypothetical protein
VELKEILIVLLNMLFILLNRQAIAKRAILHHHKIFVPDFLLAIPPVCHQTSLLGYAIIQANHIG